MIAAFCAMRPGKILVGSSRSFRGDHFYVQGTAWCGTMHPGKAKTKGSEAPMVIPEVILPLLKAWMETLDNASPDSLLFPSTKPAIPVRPEVWLRRPFRP